MWIISEQIYLILLIFLSFPSLFDQCGFLIFKHCHWPNEKPGSIKFENIDAYLFLDVHPLSFLSLLKSNYLKWQKLMFFGLKI